MKELTKGIYRENPVFVLVLGLCPALAVTTQVINGIGMGMGTMFVLICSNIMISLLKNVIPDEIHIPAYIVIIASFVTILDMVMKAYIPALSASLGVFVPLIVVNCVILGRAEAYASHNGVWDSIKDAVGMGIGFTLSLVLIALIREVLGAGTITLFAMQFGSVITEGNIEVPRFVFDGTIEIPGLNSAPARVIGLPAGALLVVGYLKAAINASNDKKGL